jgi:hypothetical protein
MTKCDQSLLKHLSRDLEEKSSRDSKKKKKISLRRAPDVVN